MNEEAVQRAVDVLGRGLPVVYPTETFYGLGADARNDGAVRTVFEIKGRGERKPLSVLVPDREAAYGLAEEIPPWARPLAETFWPGPLTLVLKGGRGLSPLIVGEDGKVGLRVSSHPWAARLARAYGSPLTATSANPSGAPPPVTAGDAAAGLAGKVPLILDGGRLPGTAGSTVLDASVYPPVLIREGEIPAHTLETIWRRYSPLKA